MSKQAKGYSYLLLTAMIWGCAFVAQSVGMQYIGPFTFQAVRCALGACTLIPYLLVSKKADTQSRMEPIPVKSQILGGVLCGAALFAATNLQQFGLLYTTVSKSGFISALYILIVPILGVFLHKKIPSYLWICILSACVGLYLLSMEDGLGSLSLGDGLTLMSAICFAIHILIVDAFCNKVDGVQLSFIQFLVSSFLSAICMWIWESPSLSTILACWLPLGYTGILSSGVAYTLQILAQKHTKPAIATLIMSLESVFAALFGWLLLKEQLTVRETLGCVFMFCATLLALLPSKKTES